MDQTAAGTYYAFMFLTDDQTTFTQGEELTIWTLFDSANSNNVEHTGQVIWYDDSARSLLFAATSAAASAFALLY